MADREPQRTERALRVDEVNGAGVAPAASTTVCSIQFSSPVVKKYERR